MDSKRAEPREILEGAVALCTQGVHRWENQTPEPGEPCRRGLCSFAYWSLLPTRVEDDFNITAFEDGS